MSPQSRSDELWDVIDAQGRPTGAVFRRGDPDWPEGKFHLVVATCVLRPDGLVLLTQRSERKEFPLTWEFPGGSATAGESSAEAAARELLEETGLSIAARSLTFVGRFSEASALVDLYLGAVSERPRLELDPFEVASADWVCADEARARLMSGAVASPWQARLDVLWDPLARWLATVSR